jgi:hypothetical protein
MTAFIFEADHPHPKGIVNMMVDPEFAQDEAYQRLKKKAGLIALPGQYDYPTLA